MRTVIISDIHGCYKELRVLLKKIQYSPKKDGLVINGDLMDRGPDSYWVWDYLINLKKANPDSVKLIWGNHELLLCNAYEKKASGAYKLWVYNGCEATVDSFGRYGYKDCKHLVPIIKKEFEMGVQIGNILISHAGSVFEDPNLMPFDEIVWNRDVVHGYTDYKGLQIIGHTPCSGDPFLVYKNKNDGICATTIEYNKRRVLPKSGIINIDTGCVYGGKLTAMCIYSNRTYQLFYEPSKEEEYD